MKAIIAIVWLISGFCLLLNVVFNPTEIIGIVSASVLFITTSISAHMEKDDEDENT